MRRMPSYFAIAEKLIAQAQLQADLEFMSDTATYRPEASCMPPGGSLEEQKIGIIGGGIAGLYICCPNFG
ncbi:hypothetical protein GOP47_0004127 [Adiantum capillus-veneris]|uniref:Uncharacterized protein n=1 Tax=Adiantum capillus-veneris TaxID=13818 RepID=A0A9D4V7H5_ADICA|nr:hypothetical protein GOP47_0004127 [Adiantum capillus-veneris]